jgi:ferredoxin-nitrite reductase
MNKIELLKRERDGLDVKALIHEYARTGWQSISEADIQRLKWHGLFLRNPTPGYFMVRVRIPGGRTNRGFLWQRIPRSHDAPADSASPYRDRTRAGCLWEA